MTRQNQTDTAKADARTAKKQDLGVWAQPAATSVDHFCQAHSISRALFYLLVRKGQGPALMHVRGRTLVSVEAAAAWRRKMEEPVARPPRVSA